MDTPRTGQEEALHHDGEVFAVALHANVPCYQRENTVYAALFPLMQALEMSRRNQRYAFDELCERGGLFLAQDPVLAPALVPLLAWGDLPRIIHWCRHPVALRYILWMNTVICATMRHGVYRPEANHEPVPGEEIDAIERKEHGRDAINAIIPGLGTALAGDAGPLSPGYAAAERDPWADNDDGTPWGNTSSHF